MIKLKTVETKIEEVKATPTKKVKTKQKPSKKLSKLTDYPAFSKRPDVVDAKVYKLKSAFVKNSVFVTLGFVTENGVKRPIEIFINSKDLSRAPEYVVLTRLISAIFRRATDPMFILEELSGIFDPSGGLYKQGKYYHSFYAEIADVIEQFFFDVGITSRHDPMPLADNGHVEVPIKPETDDDLFELNSLFKICPDCNKKTLKTENGCDNCMDPECGYSKCDK